MQAAVKAFMDKMLIPNPQPSPTNYAPFLANLGQDMVHDALLIEAHITPEDPRFVRSALLVEETGEFLIAVSCGEEVRAFDALMDIIYSAIGACVTMDFPLEAGFAEVHRSNMTKQRGGNETDRIKDKGDEFQPPDLARVLREYREAVKS